MLKWLLLMMDLQIIHLSGLNNLKDDNVIKINSKERKGHTFFYDEGMRQATNEIVGIMHSDMIIGPNYIENTLKHLERGKVVLYYKN